jgi:VWFA-related protein
MTRLPGAAFAAITIISAALSVQASTPAWASKPPQSQPQQPERQPPVHYSVDVTLVEIDAVVTDADGRPIRGLRPEDFELLEDGTPQAIDRVSFVDLPIGRAEARAPVDAAPEADVQSNRQAFDGRLYVLLLDDLHTAALRSDQVRTTASRFIEEHLQPGDLAAVVHVGKPGADSQDFTADKSRLLASVARFAGRKLRSGTLNRVDEYNRELLFTGRVPENADDPDEGARGHDARTALDSIARIAERLAPVRGRRKALIWFGEGVEYDMFDVLRRGQASAVLESSRAAVSAANRANLAIYGVDVRGLGGLGSEAMQLTSPAEDPTRGLGASGLSQELLRSQDNLRSVSGNTGGFALVNSDEFTRAFDRVVEETSAYYVLGYYPAQDRREGTFRRVEVKVKHPGVNIRARRGYLAGGRPATPPSEPERGSAAALRDALIAPIPLPGLPMAVHVAPFRGSGDKASVLVTVEYQGSAFQGHTAVDPEQHRLDTSVLAVSTSGAVADRDDSTILLNVKPETRQAMQANGFRTHWRLELPPGRYQVRVAAAIAEIGLVGSVYEDVDVPDFSARPLSMSAIVLTSTRAGLTPTARFDERMRDMLPAPPTAIREFGRDEGIALFAEIYDPGDVTVTARIRDELGQVVFERETVRTADEMKAWKNGYPLQVSLRTFSPGDYVLRLEAARQAGGQALVAREVPFRVGVPED